VLREIKTFKMTKLSDHTRITQLRPTRLRSALPLPRPPFPSRLVSASQEPSQNSLVWNCLVTGPGRRRPGDGNKGFSFRSTKKSDRRSADEDCGNLGAPFKPHFWSSAQFLCNFAHKTDRYRAYGSRGPGVSRRLGRGRSAAGSRA